MCEMPSREVAASHSRVPQDVADTRADVYGCENDHEVVHLRRVRTGACREGKNEMSHTVTIKSLPDDTTDDYGYEFGGTHGADCMTLDLCGRKACQAMNPDYEPGCERRRHGRYHLYRDGEWWVESDICALRYVFENYSDHEYFNGIPLGTYPIFVDWEDDRWWFEIQSAVRDDR